MGSDHTFCEGVLIEGENADFRSKLLVKTFQIAFYILQSLPDVLFQTFFFFSFFVCDFGSFYRKAFFFHQDVVGFYSLSVLGIIRTMTFSIFSGVDLGELWS